MVPFEEDNVEAYRLLLRIEVVVREVLRTTLQDQFGASWRKRLPGKLLEKVREAERDEDLKRQFDFACLGPLYYLTVGELVEILVQSPAKPALDRLGGPTFVAQLQNILPVRNAVGHSRDVSRSGLLCVQALYQQMLTALTVNEAARLASLPDIGLRAREAVPLLLAWLEQSLQVIKKLESPCPQTVILEKAKQQPWWGTPGVATFDCGSVEQAAEIIAHYNALPTGLGSRDARRRFVEERSPHLLIAEATRSLIAAAN